MMHARLLSWPFSRWMIFILAGAFSGLMFDLRVEHVDAVRERGVAWVPIVYSGFMTLACFVGAIVWSNASRRILIGLFVLAFIVGGLGFYFHNQGRFADLMTTYLAAWTDGQMAHPGGPPRMAPLAFAGLGFIGVLASLKRFSASKSAATR